MPIYRAGSRLEQNNAGRDRELCAKTKPAKRAL